MTSDSLRLRLQLAVGAIATLGEELPALHGRRAFAATGRESGVPLLVTLHPRPADGPDPVMLALRLGRLRELAHPVLLLPMATGELEGRAWVIEAVAAGTSAADEIADHRSLAVPHGVTVLRDLARALAALHRRGVTHGALDAETVRITPDGAILTGLGLSLGGSQREDLDALGHVVWALLDGTLKEGEPAQLSAHRRGVPPDLDALLAMLLAPDPAKRPQRAEAVLELLDAFPASRAKRPRAIPVALILLATSIVLYFLVVRRG